MSLALHLQSLIAVCLTVISTLVHPIEDNVASYYHRNHVPDIKNILRMGPEIEDPDDARTARIAANDYNNKLFTPHQRKHKKNILVEISEEKSADKRFYNILEGRELSLDDIKHAKEAATKAKISKEKDLLVDITASKEKYVEKQLFSNIWKDSDKFSQDKRTYAKQAVSKAKNAEEQDLTVHLISEEKTAEKNLLSSIWKDAKKFSLDDLNDAKKAASKDTIIEENNLQVELTASEEKSAEKKILSNIWKDAKRLSLYDVKDAQKAAGKAKILKKAKAREALQHRERIQEYKRPNRLTPEDLLTPEGSKFVMDPVLNVLRSSNLRRQVIQQSSSESSGDDTLNWKLEWQHNWLMKKYEAINQSRPQGDSVNMIAARPWGMKCGDPTQHDMPWGTCTLAVECEAELRIYRGDNFCGRTSFVCCALQSVNYDFYQGIDVSFADESFSTDSAEQKLSPRQRDEREKKREKERAKEKRKKDKDLRKKKIRRLISQTIRAIRRLLKKTYANATKERHTKTVLIKKFVKHLKKKFKQRQSAIIDIHEEHMLKVDTALMTKLSHIQALNENFMGNKTFRDIIINGTINEKGARMLVEAYPELNSYFKFRRSAGTEDDQTRDYLDYDIEYGFLYY